jgi:alginate O-acetyltransferase complex protein AlgJ
MADEIVDTARAKPGRVVPGVLFFLVMVLGGVSLAYGIVTGRVALPSSPSMRTLWSGELASEVSANLAEAPFPQLMARLERGASWLVLDSLGPRVRQGCPDWLFLMDELTVHPEAKEHSRLRMRAAAAVRERLAEKNIELLVVLVPDKSRIQREQLCGLYRPPSFSARLDSWAKGVSKAGVHVLDLEDVLARQATDPGAAPFLRTDTHWSAVGAELAARKVSETVDGMALDIQPRKQYSMERGRPSRREGDLVRLAGIEWLPPHLQPASERVESVTFREVGEAPGEVAAGTPEAGEDDAADLFGDEGLPNVALIGTSFSRTSSFLGYLDSKLATSVASFARDGGDFWGAARYYFSSPSFLETPPRLVIWEIPERVIEMPVQKEECAWISDMLPPGGAGEALGCIVK